MKKTKIVSLVLFMGIILVLNGCTSVGPTAGYASSLEEAHPDRFEKTLIGMDINEFKTVWPEATRSGLSENGETYEFIYTNLAFGGYAYNYRIYTYFYFTNNKLVKYESSKKTGL
jgi:hypothetical protein